jgi:hypothetical protein
MVAHYYRTAWIFPQSIRLMLANGSWYKADFFVFAPSGIYAYECKGPKEGKNVARGLLALKCAAHKYPKIQFMLVWKQDGKWQEQIVLP